MKKYIFKASYLLAALCFAPLAPAATCENATYSSFFPKSVESAYNRITVYVAEPCVKMTFRRVGMEYDESVLNKSDAKELPVFYTQILTVALAYPDQIKKVAMLGVGGGSTLNYLSAYLKDATLTGVELDPKVLDFAKSEFGLAVNKKLNFLESDGRVFLLRNKEIYDLVILDAYRGGYVPSHMLTKEFYQLLRTRLSASGVASINLHSGTALFDSSLKTIREVFPSVDVFPANGNVIVVASNRALDNKKVQSQAQKRQAEWGLRYSIPEILKTKQEYATTASTPVLTDDFSPANQLDQIKSSNTKRW